MKIKVLAILCMVVMLYSCDTKEAAEMVETMTTVVEDTTTTLEEIPTERVYYDDVDFPFVLDENVVGTWDVCGYVSEIDDFSNTNIDDEYVLKNLIIHDDGTCKHIYENDSAVLKWTANAILDVRNQLTGEYLFKTIGNIEYLFIEWKYAGYIFTGESEYYVLKKGEPIMIKRFEDIRTNFTRNPWEIKEEEYNFEDIKTYSYGDDIIIENNQDYAMEILENAKDPGLGIRALHARGITGEGVNVAIIDQEIVTEKYHPEYDGKIAGHNYFGNYPSTDRGSMHGPAVASLLVGETVGVAPGAKLYYAGAQSGTGDSQYYADAIHWIIEENEKLPDGEKIRVVSVSAAPSGEGSYFEKNLESYTEAVDAAFAAGILVIDCRNGFDSGFISSAYSNGGDINDVTQYNTGIPNLEPFFRQYYMHVPTSLRTTAGQYSVDDSHYTYWGNGGLSWGIPYAAGVFALGWQVNPDLSFIEIYDILFATAYINEEEARIINPTAFIEYIEANK